MRSRSPFTFFIAMLVVFAAFIFISLLAGCQNQTIRDLEGVTIKEPEKIELYVNVDKYANIVALCINGQGFVTTTRDYNAVTHIPEWGVEGGWCSK